MRLFAIPMAFVVAAFLTPISTRGETEIRQERVQFEPGTSGATIKGSISGREIVDYLVGARAGQILAVTLETDHSASYFNVIPPDAEHEAVFAGQIDESSYRDQLDLDGDWKIRVYLVRAAARRGEVANYTLVIGVTGQPDPSAAREPNDFGPREWDARGDLGCARGGQPMQTAGCAFKVLRYLSEQGATVFVRPPGEEGVRILYFSNGEWSTDSGETVETRRRSDLWSLVVGDEAYEIPEAVVFGG